MPKWIYFVLIYLIAGCRGDDTLRLSGNLKIPIPIELHGNIPTTKVRFEDGEERTFVVDTGAQYIFVGSRVANEINLQSTLLPVELPDFSLGEVTVSNAKGMAYNFPGFSDEIGVEIDGFLGASLFSNYTIGLDYKRSALYLFNQNENEYDFMIRGREDIDASSSNSTIDVLEGFAIVHPLLEKTSTRTTMLLDSGASTTILTESAEQAFPNPHRPTVQGEMGIGQVGSFGVKLTRLCDLQVGESQLSNIVAGIVPDNVLERLEYVIPGISGVLGFSVIREFVTVIDYSNLQLRLYRYRDRSHINVHETEGVGISLVRTEGGLFVGTVVPGSDAEASGIKQGDQLIAVDGIDVTSLSEKEAASRLEGELGHSFHVSVLRNDQNLEFNIKIEELLPICSS